MPTILLARHGQASFGGADYDVLSETGRRQAEALAEDLARRGVRVDEIVSGSLVRQRDTAAPIARRAGCEVAVDPGWDEYDADDILGAHSATDARLNAPAVVSRREFQELLEQALLAWIAAGDGSPAVETWPAFAARVNAALAALVARLGRGGTALVCTSGGVVAATCVALLSLSAPALVPLNRVTVNAGVTKLVHGRSGTTLVSFNDHAHLERPGDSLVTYR